jgi:hypothetical protein
VTTASLEYRQRSLLKGDTGSSPTSAEAAGHVVPGEFDARATTAVIVRLE